MQQSGKDKKQQCSSAYHMRALLLKDKKKT
jgi:hypothetical protein